MFAAPSLIRVGRSLSSSSKLFISNPQQASRLLHQVPFASVHRVSSFSAPRTLATPSLIIRRSAGDMSDKARDVAEKTKDKLKVKAQEASERLKDRAEDVKDKLKDRADDVREKIKDKAGDVREKIKDKADDVKDKAAEKGAEVATKARGKLKQLWHDYGYVALSTYLGVYFLTLGSLYLAISSQIFGAGDAISLLSKLGIDVSAINPKGSNFAVAWILTKFTEPVRFAVTVALTPKLSKMMQARFPSLFKKAPEVPSASSSPSSATSPSVSSSPSPSPSTSSASPSTASAASASASKPAQSASTDPAAVPVGKVLYDPATHTVEKQQ